MEKRNYKGIELPQYNRPPLFHRDWNWINEYSDVIAPSCSHIARKGNVKMVAKHAPDFFNMLVYGLKEEFTENECVWENYVIQNETKSVDDNLYVRIYCFDFESYGDESYCTSREQLKHFAEDMTKLCKDTIEFSVDEDCV